MSIRLPVIYKAKYFMPMRWSRAKKLEKQKKLKIKYDSKLGIYYVHLKYKPSGEEAQDIDLGIDPGTHFDGFTLISKQNHLINFQLNHNKKISDRMTIRSTYRRTRRGRLRQRPARFESRTSKKLVPAIRSMFEFRKWFILKLKYYYPIKNVVIEDVAYNHYKDTKGIGFGFSQVEQGKNVFYSFLTYSFNKVTLVPGWLTARVRKGYFKKEVKTKNKAANDFYAHCVDSFILSQCDLDFEGKLRKFGIKITKVWLNRRELYQTKAKYSDKKYLRKTLKHGKVRLLKNLKGKAKVCYTQTTPNSFKDFNLHINGELPKDLRHKKLLLSQRDTKSKQFKKAYGGTVVQGLSKYCRLEHIPTQVVGILANSKDIKHALKYSKEYKFLEFSKQQIELFN